MNLDLDTPTPSRPQSPTPSPSHMRTRVNSLRPTYSHASLRSFGSSPHLSASIPAALPPQLSVDMMDELASRFTGSINLTTDASEPSFLSGSGSGNMVVAAEVDDVDADGVVGGVSGDTKIALRDHLRRTLTANGIDQEPISHRTTQLPRVHELHHEPTDQFPPRQYFILTNAGKPVFTSQGAGAPGSDDLTSAMGLMQALISVFADEGDKIRCINAGRTRISFLLRSPLYYVCASSWREPESVMRVHLDYLHQQILSVVTASQLRRIFERRNNFDLRRLLDGTDGFLFSLLRRLEDDMGLTMGSLGAMRLDHAIRAKAGDLIVPPKDMRDILYVLLISRSTSRVITLTRPRKQSIHPSDLHVLLNTLSSPSLSAHSAPSSSSWLPICLPKYNADVFLHVFVSFLSSNGEDILETSPATTPPASVTSKESHSDHDSVPAVVQSVETGKSTGADAPSERGKDDDKADGEIGLVVVTPRRDDFERVRGWTSSVEEALRSNGILTNLAVASRRHEYSVDQLGIPGLRHFLYKSRSHVQVSLPAWEDPYDQPEERKRLITLYQFVHDALLARSGQVQGPLKLQLIRTDKEIVMGWITQPFELLVTVSPHMPKSAVVGAANAVAKWVKKEEGRLFIRDAPVF